MHTIALNLTVRNRLFAILGSLIISACCVLPVASQASTAESVWGEGLVLTKTGRIADHATITIRNVAGDKVIEDTTDDEGNFIFYALPISSDAYNVTMKYRGDTYRYSMLIDDEGYLHHHAVLFRLANTESSAINLNDHYTYYRKGARETDADGRVVYLVTRTPETDAIEFHLYSYHLDSGQVHKMTDLMNLISTNYKTSVAFSPNGHLVASVNDQRLTIWKVTTLERQMKRTLNDDRYFSDHGGAGLQAGDYHLDWTDNSCVTAAVYQAAPTEDDEYARELVENRNYCL